MDEIEPRQNKSQTQGESRTGTVIKSDNVFFQPGVTIFGAEKGTLILQDERVIFQGVTSQISIPLDEITVTRGSAGDLQFEMVGRRYKFLFYNPITSMLILFLFVPAAFVILFKGRQRMRPWKEFFVERKIYRGLYGWIYWTAGIIMALVLLMIVSLEVSGV